MVLIPKYMLLLYMYHVNTIQNNMLRFIYFIYKEIKDLMLLNKYSNIIFIKRL
jgi:hypothetical protein